MATPFPWRPMVAIALCLVTVTYTLCSLFPYVGYMVRYLGVTNDKDAAGYYAGYLSSAFMVGCFCGSYFWGRFADRYGRLPVMYMGLYSTAFLSVVFGFSASFFWAVACRFLTGALNGVIANARIMISEVCGSEHEVMGMSLATGCWSIGLVLGSGLGGLLAEPAHQYPALFPESGLFGRFPYLLPNVLGTSLALISLPVVFFFLEETLDVHKGGNRSGFERIPTPKAEFHSQEKAAEEKGDIRATCLDNVYDPQLANGEGARATPGSGGNNGCLTVDNKGGSISGSVQARVDERLLLVTQHLRSPSGTPELEEGESRSVRDGTRGHARSGVGSIGEGGGVDAGGGKRQGEGRIVLLREFLLPFKLLDDTRVRTALFVYGSISLIAVGFDEAYPLWAISSGGSGGLDWTILQVGQALAACGGGILVVQLWIYPFIATRLGPRRPQHWLCCIAIPVYLAFPLLSRLRDSGGVLMTASVVMLFFTNFAVNAVFMNAALAVNNAVDPSQRGTLNGLAAMIGSLAKGAGPIFSSTIFAWSIDRRRPFPLDQHLMFYLFSLGMLVVSVTSWNLDICPAEPKTKDSAVSPVEMARRSPEGLKRRVLA